MSLVSWIRSHLPRRCSLQDPGVTAARAQWREEIHRNRNEVAKTVYSARLSRRVSKAAKNALQEAMSVQESGMNLRRTEIGLIRRLRDEE